MTIKLNKEIASDSLQNPSDSDATYDGHKAKGYQVQIAETYSTEENEDTLRLITYVAAEPAHENDANAIIPYLEATQARDVGPEKVLADTLYGSDHNCREAGEKGVELVAPCMGSCSKGQCSLCNFTFSDNGKVIACPQRHEPLKVKKKDGRFSVMFASEACMACPLADQCPVKAGKHGYYLRYDKKSLRLAQRRALEDRPEFKEKYRFRAGVEATMSQYDRRTGVKHLRFRGLKAIRLCAFLKATGVNIFRIAAFNNRQNAADDPAQGTISVAQRVFHLLKAIKEGLKVDVRVNYWEFEQFCPYSKF